MRVIHRKEYPEYPIEAYRESIVNAVIHFDYFLGDTIAIEKLKTKIVINNKGELLFPKSEFGKKSESRNRLLVDLLARTNYMEKAGTGIQRVINACKENSNKIDFSFTDSFWITIQANSKDKVPNKVPNKVPDKVPDKVSDKVSDKVPDNISENQKQIIDLILKDSRISMSKMSENIGISKRKILDNMNKLREKGLIKRIGTKKSGEWVVQNYQR